MVQHRGDGPAFLYMPHRTSTRTLPGTDFSLRCPDIRRPHGLKLPGFTSRRSTRTGSLPRRRSRSISKSRQPGPQKQ